MNFIELTQVTKCIDKDFYILKDINITVKHGEFLSIVGRSGSGKSTLLKIMGCMEKASSGRLIFDGVDISMCSDNELADIRNRKIGFIFQEFNLIPQLTVRKNVELPLIFSSKTKKHRNVVVDDLLDRVGISSKADAYPATLSGGERQRVAIARAIANQPRIILADEPTGNLDSENEIKIINLLRNICKQLATTLVIVTHNPSIAEDSDRIISLFDGQIVAKEGIAPNPIEEKVAT